MTDNAPNISTIGRCTTLLIREKLDSHSVKTENVQTEILRTANRNLDSVQFLGPHQFYARKRLNISYAVYQATLIIKISQQRKEVMKEK